MSTYRYPGVKPFETSDRHIFFGRDQDIADLYDLLVLEKLVVLFGKSGYGKSSLLNAGILPKFQTVLPDSDISYQPIIVRFNLYVDDKSIPPLEQVRRRLLEETKENPEGNFLANDTIWQQFKKRQTAADRHFLLVFDQFEEFFSYPQPQQTVFKEELAELLYKTLPQAVRDALDDYTAEQRRYLAQKLDVKAVFAIRSDRMSDLDSLKDRLPAILYKRYELKGLNPDQARRAIIAPAALPKADNDFISDAFHYTDSALDKIIQELTGSISRIQSGGLLSLREGQGEAGAEAFQLQILCQYIESQVIAGRIRDRNGDGAPDVHADDLPNLARVYEAYYRSRLDELDPAERDAARELIEYGLLYEDVQKGEARRLSVDADLLVQQFAAQGATHALLKKLQDTFLLRREMNTLGTYNYELSHDTLIAPVLKAKAEREADKARRAAERRAQEAEAEARAERSRSRRARVLAVVGFLLAGISIAALILAFFANREANRQRLEALNQKIEADKATQLAKAETIRADSSALIAQNKSDEAEKAYQQAAANLKRAQTEEAKAKAALLQVEKEKNATEAQRKRAEENFEKAQAATKVATEAQETAEANRYRAEQDYAELQRVAAQTVALLLREADQEILQLNYAAARDKCEAAKSLGVQRLEVQKRVLEIAFFYEQTGQDREAFTTLRDLLGRGFTSSSIPYLDSTYYDTLLRRYYPEMVPVEGGTFVMGKENGKEDEKPHRVTLSSYQMAKTETTVWQYNLFAVATGKELEAPGWGLWGDNPIVNVNWYDAVEYANWLSKRMNLDSVYTGNSRSVAANANWQATGYRLPTEAEWEFAARGGNLEKDKNYTYAGGNKLDELGWYSNNSKNRTQPVAQKKPNALGLYDMSGNVWEWCWDWYDAYPDTSVQNPTGPPGGAFRVVRGGSWYYDPNNCRAAVRFRDRPASRDFDIGFRVVRH
jgi:formylglycine-generating enzyme required for sulfatase activity